MNQKILILKLKISLKQYANKYNVNWGFVRDYDKNDSLYLCNTEYTEDMENENWKLLKNFLGNEVQNEVKINKN